MDLKKLTPGEMVVSAAGILLLIFSFFHWYGVDLGPLSVNRSGWQSPGAFWSIIAILIGIVMAAQVIATKLFAVDLGAKVGNIGWGTILLFLIIKVINQTTASKFGLYAGLVCGAGLAVGGYLIAKERNELPAFLNKGAAGPSPSGPPASGPPPA